MTEIIFLIGLFKVLVVEQDYDKKYNVLLEQIVPNTGHLVAFSVTKPSFEENKTEKLSIKAECSKVFEVTEQNGDIYPRRSTNDGWILNRKTYICNALEVNNEKVD